VTILVEVPKFEGVDRKEFTVDLSFTKAQKSLKGDLVLSGYASTWGVDRDGEFVHPEAFNESLPGFLAKNPLVLWQHDPAKPIGFVNSATTDAFGLAVEITVTKPAKEEPDWRHLVYNQIERGVLRTFSIGGWMDRVWEEAVMRPMIAKVDLMEISVVGIPANEDSIFAAAVKAVRGGDPSVPRLRPQVIEQMEEILGMRDAVEPSVVSIFGDPVEKQLRYVELASIYQKAGHEVPLPDQWSAAVSLPDDTRDEQLAKLDAIERAITVVNGLPIRHDEIKTGRVISKTNETLLRNAIDALRQSVDAAKASSEAIDAVLSQLPDAQDGQGARAAADPVVAAPPAPIPPVVPGKELEADPNLADAPDADDGQTQTDAGEESEPEDEAK
jgi:HK97 family phage prohead protease